MKLIAHRGLMEGPDKYLENHPDQIYKALERGFDCEVDVWLIDQQLFLGHDKPQYLIDRSFLDLKGLWIHAKNLASLYYLIKTTGLIYFWHQEDYFTLTSNKYIWAYPGQLLTDRSISVMPEWADPEFLNLDLNSYAICSDYILKIQKIIGSS